MFEVHLSLSTGNAGINKGGQHSCLVCKAKGEAAPGTSTYRLWEATAPLRTNLDWKEDLAAVQVAPTKVKHINGVKRQVKGTHPLADMPGHQPALTTLPDYMHSAHGYGAKKMVPCYIPQKLTKTQKKEEQQLRPTRHIPVAEIPIMNSEMLDIARPTHYKKPICNLALVSQRKMMETHKLVLNELRLLMCGRIDEDHYSQMVHNYIVPLSAAFGYCGGEVILEHTQELFGRKRFGAYLEFVRENLGFGYMSPVLHNLSHGDIIASEAGGFRSVICGSVVCCGSIIPLFAMYDIHAMPAKLVS